MEQTIFELWSLFNRAYKQMLEVPSQLGFFDQNLGQPAVKQVFLAVLLYYKRSFFRKLQITKTLKLLIVKQQPVNEVRLVLFVYDLSFDSIR